MKFILSTFLLIISFSVSAGNTWSNNPKKITGLTFYSHDESIYPKWKGLLQVKLDGLSWATNSSCNTHYVVVRSSDSHLVSAILAAKVADKAISVYADDALRIDGYCYLRAIGL